MTTAPTVTGFDPIPLGTVRGTAPDVTAGAPVSRRVRLRYPTRLNAMALDASKVLPGGGGFPAGELLFVCDLFRSAQVELTGSNGEVTVAPDCAQPVVARHAAQVMRSLLRVSDGLHVSIGPSPLPSHVGLGSSSGTMAAVAAAVNELYGSPLDAGALVRLLVDNHGEEIDGADDVLLPVQAIGGSAAAGLVKGAVQVVAGDAVPILRGDLAGDYEVVLAVPRDLRSWDAAESLEAEAAHFDGFRRTGEVHGRDIAYRLLHNAWPALVTGSLRELGELVYDYRFHMGSIANCGFSHPRLAEIADSLTTVFESGAADVLSLSSVGPLFFAVTRNPAAVEGHFGAADLVTFRARPWSHGYVVEAE